MSAIQIRKWKSFIKDEANLFVIKIIAVYAGWKVVHYFLLNADIASHVWLKFIDRLGSFYSGISSAILNWIGEETFHAGISVFYKHSGRFIMAQEHCLAIPATVVFTGSILFFRGSWKNKLWFIPFGILAVFVINMIRFVFLCYTFEHFSATFFEINHSLIYVVVTYSLIMLLIIWWMNKFSKPSELNTTN